MNNPCYNKPMQPERRQEQQGWRMNGVLPVRNMVWIELPIPRWCTHTKDPYGHEDRRCTGCRNHEASNQPT